MPKLLLILLFATFPVMASDYYRNPPPVPSSPTATATATSSSNDKLSRVLVNGAIVGLIWCGVCYSMDGCFKSRWCGPSEAKTESGSMVPNNPPNGFIDNRSRIETTTEVKGGR